MPRMRPFAECRAVGSHKKSPGGDATGALAGACNATIIIRFTRTSRASAAQPFPTVRPRWPFVVVFVLGRPEKPGPRNRRHSVVRCGGPGGFISPRYHPSLHLIRPEPNFHAGDPGTLRRDRDGPAPVPGPSAGLPCLILARPGPF
jgi:hypothetical protein